MSVDDYRDRDREGGAEERTGVGGRDQDAGTWDPGGGREDAGTSDDDHRDREGDAEERSGLDGQSDDDESLDDLAAQDANPEKPTI